MFRAVLLASVLSLLFGCAASKPGSLEPIAPRPTIAFTDTLPFGAVQFPLPPESPSDELVLRELVDSAYAALAPSVRIQSHPEALQYALKAYYQFRTTHPERVRKPYFYFVDFGLDAGTARGYFFDMDALRVVDGPFMVAHGRGSVEEGDLLPMRFSNVNGSLATSLGLYLAEETYGFHGTSGGHPYRSIGLRMDGMSGPFNSAARSRGIVVHGAPYVTEEKAGRSEGCPAMEPERAERLLPMLSGGGVVFHFSPYDWRWMSGDPWAAVGATRYAAGL
jgi:hypothetical protein